MKASKRKSGVTLMELIIAVGVLLVASVALFNLFSYGFTRSNTAHRRNMAGIEALIQMERLVGRAWAGDLESENWVAPAHYIDFYGFKDDGAVPPNPIDSDDIDKFFEDTEATAEEINGFDVRILQAPYPDPTDVDSNLRQVDIVISEIGANRALFVHRNILNVSGKLV
ncbi:MAG: hypothetical protein FWG87_11085 [Defluviitaleaceae bacterium]|nr:hypothetical protein [Defluviitaleaceae bacterium]